MCKSYNLDGEAYSPFFKHTIVFPAASSHWRRRRTTHHLRLRSPLSTTKTRTNQQINIFHFAPSPQPWAYTVRPNSDAPPANSTYAQLGRTYCTVISGGTDSGWRGKWPGNPSRFAMRIFVSTDLNDRYGYWYGTEYIQKVSLVWVRTGLVSWAFDLRNRVADSLVSALQWV